MAGGSTGPLGPQVRAVLQEFSAADLDTQTAGRMLADALIERYPGVDREALVGILVDMTAWLSQPAEKEEFARVMGAAANNLLKRGGR